jgi:outer membrane receptor protein involved in Fe transport
MRTQLLASAAVSILWCAASPASAQTTDVSEIVVTGEKSERSLQDTQASVAVITARRIEREQIQTLSEIFNRTANVAETFGGSGVTIRGIANNGVTGGGDAPLSTIYVDGAPMPSTTLFSGPTDAWDVRQVEIFRGPQSTLQGLNALAGAIFLRTQEPTFDRDLRARLIVTDPQDTAYAVAGGGPIVADQLAFRLSGEKRDSDGTIRNVTRDAPENPIDTLTVRAKLLMAPVQAPNLRAQLGYTRFESHGGYRLAYSDTNTPDFYEHRTADNNRRNGGDNQTDILNFEVRYALSEHLALNSVSTLSQVKQGMPYDGDDGPQDTAYGVYNYDYETLTQELRLNYEGERASGLLGVFYSSREQQQDSTSRTSVPTPVTTIAGVLIQNGFPAATANLIAGRYVAALPSVPVDYSVDAPLQVKTYALFGDGRWALTDRLSLLGGFRWDHEDNAIQLTQTAVFVGAYPNPASFGAPGSTLYLAIAGINQAVGQFVSQAAAAGVPAERSFDAFLPKLGLRFDLTDAVNAALVVQRGYRSGGSSLNVARGRVSAYDPEFTWNYEASLRSAWLDGALTLGANAYYVDWTDQQLSVNFGLNQYDYNTVNAGRSHLYGFEIEAAHRVSQAFDWYGSAGYSKTEFDDFVVGTGPNDDLSGSEFAYAPRWTLALGGEWRFGGGLVANLNASYRSGMFTDSGLFQRGGEVGARTLVNGRLGYEADHWGLYLFGKNLFDQRYMNYNQAAYSRAVLGAPRTVGAQLEARW